VIIEAIIGILATAFLIYTMKSMLLFGETTLAHDNLLWNYPVFQFFAENIINGHFPLWNPFSHAGEPFYPIIGQMRLLEPITLLIIYLGKFISNDIVMLFNWNRFILSIIMACGVYIVLRRFANHLFIRLSLIPILLYSSFMLGSFRQDAILNQFLWLPFVAHFLLRIIYYKDYRWHNWLLLAGLIGLNWQSYFFTGTWIFLLFFFIGLLFFRRDLLIELFKAKKVVLKISLLFVIILAMAMPNIVLMLEKDKYVFPARMIDVGSDRSAPRGAPLQYEAGISSTVVESINMPYSFIIFTGTFSNIWDFIQFISPDGNNYVGWPSRTGWGKPSEAYMYIGFLPWAIALLGFVAGRHDMKRVWMLLAGGFGLLMLGPAGGLHKLLYYIYPPMWFVRHTHTFVLFFIFAILYFYVLGLNRIFSTWDRSVFESNTFTGILRRFIKIKEDYIHSIAIFIFSTVIVLSVYWMTTITYPYTNYLFIFIISTFIIGWILWKDLGEKGLYISLLASHVIIVFIFSENTYKFTRYIIPALGLPIALFMFIKMQRKLSETTRYNLSLVLLLVFSTALTLDLIYSFKISSFLYQATAHPAISHKIDTTIHKSYSLQDRSIYPKVNLDGNSEQGMRYLPTVYRKPFVFSSIMEPNYDGSYVQAKNIFAGLANKSFENWTASSSGRYLPEQFVYDQDGDGGGIEKYTAGDGIKDGGIAVLLTPSSIGDSFIRYQTSQIEEIRGRHIRLSVWVKSQNKSRDAVQIQIQDDIGPPISKSYNNSGDWEHLIIGKYIDRKAKQLTVRCNIRAFATNSAYFDGITIEIVDVINEFEYALRSKRWSSFLLLKNYFELINADIHPSVLEEMFAVNKPLFQFKEKAVMVKEGEFPDFLRQLGLANSVELLREAVIIDGKNEPYLTKIKGGDKYQNGDNALTVTALLNEVRSNSDAMGKNSFTYAIENYNYNSFEIKVSTDNKGILYWADGYDKNWHAYINGKEVPIYRANINFKAISLPKGASAISFVYDPFWFKAGLFVFYGTLIACILTITVSRGAYYVASFRER